MQTTFTLVAASAVLSLTVLSSAALTPVLAIDEDVDFVCYDTTDARGNEDLECQTVEDFAADCAALDPDHLSDECKMLDGETVVIGGLLPTPPAPQVPQSLSGPVEEQAASGRPGGGFILLTR